MRTNLREIVALSLLSVSAGLPLCAQPAGPGKALDRANLDTTCAACKDFYQFANGSWLKKTTIPAAYSSFGSFRDLADRNEALLHKILDADAKAANAGKSPGGEGSFKVGAFYASCLDTVAIDHLGIAPLKPDLDAIESIGNAQDPRRELGNQEREPKPRSSVGAQGP
jgi:putative endopeptidase